MKTLAIRICLELAFRRPAAGCRRSARASKGFGMETPKRPLAHATDNRPQPGAGARSATESKALLSQCRELARSKLSRILAEAIEKVENDLFLAAEASTSRAEQQVLFEAMSQVKKHRSDIATSFDRHFIEIFERRVTSRRASTGKSQELKLDELTLLDDNAVEEDLVIRDLARKTNNRIDQDQMMGIRARFGHLLSTEELEDSSNPLSTEAVFEALRLACARIPGEFAVKRSLLNAFQPYVAAGITNVYADVNQSLIAHHILPRIHHRVKRAADVGVQSRAGEGANAMSASQAMNLGQLMGNQPGVGASQLMNLQQLFAGAGGFPGGMPGASGAGGFPGGMPGVGGGGVGGTAGMAATGAFDLSALLASVMNGPPAMRAQVARALAEPAQYAFEGALATPATPELIGSLTQLQANPGFGPALTPAEFLGALDQQVRNQSHPLDQLTIELVTMVFDYILDDRSIPETIKAEIARMQIVAIKAAILDRTFFARRQHPMRQLLDRIAEAAADPEVATHDQSRFVIGLHGMVDYIVHHFTDDLTVFTVAQEKLEELLREDAQNREREIAPTTVELAKKEEAEIAHATALAEIKRRVTRRTPGFVREFLYHWWTKTLVDAYMKNREGDDSWTHRLGVVDALVWSVSPLRTGEIQQLAAMLPTLMRSLLRGMNAIDVPAEARHGFFNQLMQAHTASITLAKSQAKGATPGESAATLVPAAPEPEPEPEPEPDDPATGPVTNSGMDDYYLHTAMALERGAVVEFGESAAAAIRAKLSWVSPQQTILLFTSISSGARQLQPKVLAALLREGKAKVLESSEALMDRVVNAMVSSSGDEAMPAAA
jgi:hypothetical protein